MDAPGLFAQTLSGCYSTVDTTWRCMARLPRAPADRWITRLWELDGICPPSREREFPRGDLAIVVRLAGRHALLDGNGERTFGDAWVAGLQERSFVTASGGRAWLCGARLTAEGAYRLFRVPPRELINRMVPLDAVLGPVARELVDQLHEAPTAGDRLARLGEFLVDRIDRPCRWSTSVAWALDYIADRPAGICVASLAREIGWSEKHLHRRFVESVGVGPRRMARVTRFNAAIRSLWEEPQQRLATLADASGYYDQAHFAREFRDMAGITATDYLRTRKYSLDYGFARVDTSDSSKT